MGAGELCLGETQGDISGEPASDLGKPESREGVGHDAASAHVGGPPGAECDGAAAWGQ